MPCALYPIAFRANTFNGLDISHAKKHVLFDASGTGNTAAGIFAWLAFNGSDSLGKLLPSLPAPGESGRFTIANKPSNAVPSIGDWVVAQPNIGSDAASQLSYDFLEQSGFIAPAPLWDQVRWEGTTLEYHISGFAWFKIREHTSFPPTELTLLYWGSADCSAK